jgi:4'-phosphopantetheinyl transferase
VAILSEFDVHIWYCITELLDCNAISTANSHLSIREKSRRDRFRFDADRRDFTVAHDLLRQALSSYADLSPSDWQFSIDACGKPSIDSNDPKLRELSFSLSHTQGFVACAITKKVPVGIDVEQIDQSLRMQEIADRYLTAEEAQQLRGCSEEARNIRLTELWTLKEAFLKAVGIGHFGSFTDISFRLDEHRNIEFSAPTIAGFQEWQFALFEPLADVRMSIAIAGSSPPRYHLHPYDGRMIDSLLASPSKHSAARPNRGGLPL